jgi:hypothetical protein
MVAVGIEYDRYQESLSRSCDPVTVERALIVGSLGRSRCRLPLRPLGRLQSLYFAVGLGPETPCKLTAAPEAIPLSPRLFREVRYERHSPDDVYTQPCRARDGL